MLQKDWPTTRPLGGLVHYYTDVLKKYVDFSGRARRQEVWMFVLCNMVVEAVVLTLDVLFGAMFILYAVYTLAIALPAISLTVRRLHDLGKAGWWYFIGCIPIIGWIWMLVLMATAGQPHENKYGPSPKSIHRVPSLV
ncbi:DUF805 domain-containing protein [Streptomyces sp. NPDC091371]|uniref:DUF805 domain-containing protein n=1 Tax=Streptomyces sp. NPDC091371 TaxID=3155303 RepID=UPI003423CFA9